MAVEPQDDRTAMMAGDSTPQGAVPDARRGVVARIDKARVTRDNDERRRAEAHVWSTWREFEGSLQGAWRLVQEIATPEQLALLLPVAEQCSALKDAVLSRGEDLLDAQQRVLDSAHRVAR